MPFFIDRAQILREGFNNGIFRVPNRINEIVGRLANPADTISDVFIARESFGRANDFLAIHERFSQKHTA